MRDFSTSLCESTREGISTIFLEIPWKLAISLFSLSGCPDYHRPELASSLSERESLHPTGSSLVVSGANAQPANNANTARLKRVFDLNVEICDQCGAQSR